MGVDDTLGGTGGTRGEDDRAVVVDGHVDGYRRRGRTAEGGELRQVVLGAQSTPPPHAHAAGRDARTGQPHQPCGDESWPLPMT